MKVGKLLWRSWIYCQSRETFVKVGKLLWRSGIYCIVKVGKLWWRSGNYCKGQETICGVRETIVKVVNLLSKSGNYYESREAIVKVGKLLWELKITVKDTLTYRDCFFSLFLGKAKLSLLYRKAKKSGVSNDRNQNICQASVSLFCLFYSESQLCLSKTFLILSNLILVFFHPICSSFLIQKSFNRPIMAPRVKSALSFIGEVHIGVRALNVLNLIWFGYIARLSQWGGGGNFLVQMISTCLRYT